jgi:PTS system mannose-specific IIA component
LACWLTALRHCGLGTVGSFRAAVGVFLALQCGVVPLFHGGQSLIIGQIPCITMNKHPHHCPRTLAHALRQCALHVFPDCEQCGRVDVQPNMSPDETLGSARIMLAQLGDGAVVKGVLVLTDIFGATPCNVAQKLVERASGAKLVTGVNLPMLLRSVSYLREPLDAVVTRAMAVVAPRV